jgi:hypothetical protein
VRGLSPVQVVRKLVGEEVLAQRGESHELVQPVKQPALKKRLKTATRPLETSYASLRRLLGGAATMSPATSPCAPGRSGRRFDPIAGRIVLSVISDFPATISP